MFRMFRPSQDIDLPAEDEPSPQAALLPQDSSFSPTHRSSAYFQRLGIQGTGEAEKPSLIDGLSPKGPDGLAQTDIRQKFLRKLAYNNVWVPTAHRSPKHQTVIIFDWDDTLLCTSWLRQREYERSDDDILQTIVQHSKNLLEMAIKAGNTYVITNAMSGWVEYSAARWAPELLPVLRQVQVISARAKFEAAFPDNVSQWKIQAFLEVQRQLDATPITNLIALGDADYEMEAAQIMGAQFEEGAVKTVKFRPNPNPHEHLQQLQLVVDSAEKIIGSVKNLKVILNRSFSYTFDKTSQ